MSILLLLSFMVIIILLEKLSTVNMFLHKMCDRMDKEFDGNEQ
jgi:hypothetical protein